MRMVRKSINKGLSYLESAQSDGAFESSLSLDCSMSSVILDPSLFATGVVCLNLLEMSGLSIVGRILSQGCKRLVKSMRQGGIWAYWDGPGVPRGQLIVPDVDDTAVFSFVLMKAGYESPGSIGSILEKQGDSGLFGTWLYPLGFRMHGGIESHCQYDEPDLIVNMNAALPLELAGVAQSRVTEWALSVVRSGNTDAVSLFYDRSMPYVLFQVILRNRFFGIGGLDGCDEVIKKELLSRQSPDGSWGNSLLTALAVYCLSSLTRESDVMDRAIEVLCGMQQPDGGWESVGFYGSRHIQACFGSRAVTSAFALSALHRVLGMPGAVRS